MTSTRAPTESSPPGTLTPLEPQSAEGASILLSPEEIEARARKKEEEFTAAITRHERMLRAFTAYWVDCDEVDDIVQDAWVIAWRTDMIARCGGDDAHIEAYLRTAVRHRVANKARRQKREDEGLAGYAVEHRSQSDDADAPDKQLIASETEWLLHDAIMELPAHYRDPFILARILHKSYAETAEELHMTVDTVDVYIRRALRRLSRSRSARLALESLGVEVEDTP